MDIKEDFSKETNKNDYKVDSNELTQLKNLSTRLSDAGYRVNFVDELPTATISTGSGVTTTLLHVQPNFGLSGSINVQLSRKEQLKQDLNNIVVVKTKPTMDIINQLKDAVKKLEELEKIEAGEHFNKDLVELQQFLIETKTELYSEPIK